MTRVLLEGCSPTPLGSYLKALGLLRLVAEQRDPEARGRWTAGSFELDSALDQRGLVRFLVEEYVPTPIVAPWNGESGFYPKYSQVGISAIESSRDARFAPYRHVIAACRTAVLAAGLAASPKDEEKAAFLAGLRATLPEAALAWMDAAVVLGGDRPEFPPLFGTGGNDGRLDFTNNYMQRLAGLLLVPRSKAQPLANSCLFARPSPYLERAAIGQFAPAAAGGANAGPAFSRDSLVNPWDYVLLLEGALLFAAAVTRRDEVSSPGTMSFPFCVRAASAGYATAAARDVGATRAEMWLPLWDRFASPLELQRLFGEGRAKVKGLAARSGLDFARAVASLGVDRGISSFQRIAFHKRNGDSYFAIPLGVWPVQRRRHVDLLDAIDGWIIRVRRAADGKHAPASLVRAAARLDEAVLELCRGDDVAKVAGVLIALGEVEAVATRSPKAREAIGAPVPALSPEWLVAADDGSPEFRLAASLAATGIRRHMAAVDPRRPWTWAVDEVEQVWGECDLVQNLGEVLRRREHHASDPLAIAASARASLGDVAAFVRGEVEEQKIERLLRGICLVDLREPWPHFDFQGDHSVPPVAYALLRCAREVVTPDSGRPMRTPGLLARVLSGDVWAATRLAERRLRGAGWLLRCGAQHTSPQQARRIGAALVFPLSRRDVERTRELILRPRREEPTYHD